MHKLFNLLLVALVIVLAITTLSYAFMRTGGNAFGSFHGRTNFITVSL